MDDVRRREPREHRQIDRLIDQRAETTDVANPAERARKPRIDRDEGDDVPIIAQPVDQAARLHALATQDVEAGRDNGHARLSSVHRSFLRTVV